MQRSLPPKPDRDESTPRILDGLQSGTCAMPHHHRRPPGPQGLHVPSGADAVIPVTDRRQVQDVVVTQTARPGGPMHRRPQDEV